MHKWFINAQDALCTNYCHRVSHFGRSRGRESTRLCPRRASHWSALWRRVASWIQRRSIHLDEKVRLRKRLPAAVSRINRFIPSCGNSWPNKGHFQRISRSEIVLMKVEPAAAISERRFTPGPVGGESCCISACLSHEDPGEEHAGVKWRAASWAPSKKCDFQQGATHDIEPVGLWCVRVVSRCVRVGVCDELWQCSTKAHCGWQCDFGRLTQILSSCTPNQAGCCWKGFKSSNGQENSSKFSSVTFFESPKKSIQNKDTNFLPWNQLQENKKLKKRKLYENWIRIFVTSAPYHAFYCRAA